MRWGQKYTAVFEQLPLWHNKFVPSVYCSMLVSTLVSHYTIKISLMIAKTGLKGKIFRVSCKCCLIFWDYHMSDRWLKIRQKGERRWMREMQKCIPKAGRWGTEVQQWQMIAVKVYATDSWMGREEWNERMIKWQDYKRGQLRKKYFQLNAAQKQK